LYCHDEDWFREGVTEEIKTTFNLENLELKFAFIDSWAKHPANIGDPLQQIAFERETETLWNFAVTREEFAFKSIQDILEENIQLKSRVDFLEDLVDFNLTEIMQVLKSNTEELTLLSEYIFQVNYSINCNSKKIQILSIKEY